MSTYISGPMSGYPDYNRAAFHAAAAALRVSRDVANPAELVLGEDAEWADYMRHHLATIADEVTEVVVLPGWEASRGARLEVHVAHALGIQVVPLAVAVLHDFDRCPECFGPLDPHGPNAVTA